MDAVQRYCDRALYIDKGVVRAIGDTPDVINAYLLDVFERGAHESTVGTDLGPGKNDGTPAMLLGCDITPEALDSCDELTLAFRYRIGRDTPVELRFAIVKDGAAIAHMSTHGTDLDHRVGTYDAEFRMEMRPFLEGRHLVTGGIFHAGTGEPLDLRSELGAFYVRDGDIARSGLMRVPGRWTRLPRGAA
jgi:lipopolysaccharide transport system ATP-binding protein